MKTAEFAVEAGIDLPRFAVVTPSPKTALYNRLEAEGRILTRDWELYDGQHVVFQPRHLSVRELQDGVETAWKYAYRWRSIARRMARSPAPWPVRIGTNLGYRFYAHRLSQFYNCDMGAFHPSLCPEEVAQYAEAVVTGEAEDTRFSPRPPRRPVSPMRLSSRCE